MSASSNKQIVIEFLHNLAEGRRAEARAALAEDATWQAQPSLSKEPFISRDDIFDIYFKIDVQLFDTGVDVYRWEILIAIAEDDTVAIEMRHYSKTLKGEPYQTDYHVLYGLNNGKIQWVHEYFDSLYMDQVCRSLKVEFPKAPKVA
jgi:ketosteroid isomerase-like protein